jgi:hypothetical protein
MICSRYYDWVIMIGLKLMFWITTLFVILIKTMGVALIKTSGVILIATLDTLLCDPFWSIGLFIGMDMGIHIVLGIGVLFSILKLFCIIMLSCVIKFSFSDKAMLKDDVKKIIVNKTHIGIRFFIFNLSPPISMIDHSSTASYLAKWLSLKNLARSGAILQAERICK